jgi:hypothetical protein
MRDTEPHVYLNYVGKKDGQRTYVVKMEFIGMAGQEGWDESGKVRTPSFNSLDDACGYRDFLYDRVFDCTGATPGKGKVLSGSTTVFLSSSNYPLCVRVVDNGIALHCS